MTLPFNPPRPIKSRCSRAASISRKVSSVAGVLDTAILHQFDRLHQPHAPDIADQRILLFQVLKTSPQVSADGGGVTG